MGAYWADIDRALVKIFQKFGLDVNIFFFDIRFREKTKFCVSWAQGDRYTFFSRSDG